MLLATPAGVIEDDAADVDDENEHEKAAAEDRNGVFFNTGYGFG